MLKQKGEVFSKTMLKFDSRRGDVPHQSYSWIASCPNKSVQTRQTEALQVERDFKCHEFSSGWE